MSIEKLLPENYYKCNNIWHMYHNEARTKFWYDEIVSGNRITFVYVEDDNYLGETSLVLKNDDPDYTIENRRIYLSRMIVKNEARNRGIGSSLLDFVTAYAKQLGYSEISLGVDIVNVGARWLYEKNGFINILYVGEDSDGKYVKLMKKL